MPQTFHIRIPPGGQPPLRFPQQCISCGAPPQAESTLLLTRLVLRGRRQTPVTVRCQVPHCDRCARTTRSVFLAGLIPFVLGGLLLGGATFVWAALGLSVLGLDEVGQPNNANSLLVGAAAGLAVGLAGGLLAEVLARLVLLPFFGRALLQAPLLAVQLLHDSDYVAGLTGRLDAQAAWLQLTFANDDAARGFAAANPEALDRAP